MLPRALGWLIAGLWLLCRALLIAWATLAIYYSNLPWLWLRIALALAFAAFAVWAVLLSRQQRMVTVASVLFLGVVAWWISIPPSHDRSWRPEVAVMPRAFIDGDRVRLTGVRNFDYRSRNDFTVRYEEREVQLSHLTGLDFYVSFMMGLLAVASGGSAALFASEAAAAPAASVRGQTCMPKHSTESRLTTCLPETSSDPTSRFSMLRLSDTYSVFSLGTAS